MKQKYKLPYHIKLCVLASMVAFIFSFSLASCEKKGLGISFTSFRGVAVDDLNGDGVLDIAAWHSNFKSLFMGCEKYF